MKIQERAGRHADLAARDAKQLEPGAKQQVLGFRELLLHMVCQISCDFVSVGQTSKRKWGRRKINNAFPAMQVHYNQHP